MQGITNIGNTCYMNSVLQMLYKLEQFMLDVDQIYTNSKENSFFVTHYFMETYYMLNNNEQTKPQWLNEFRQVINTQYPQFTLNEQQDAQEFLLALIDLLHEELRNPQCGKIPLFEFKEDGQITLGSLLSFIEYENSPITKHFGNIIKTSLSCQHCQYRNNKLEIVFSLILNVESPKNTVLELLQYSMNEEEVKMKCEQCKNERKFKKQTNVIKFSDEMILCLNRYKIPRGLIERWWNGVEIQKSNKSIILTQQLVFQNKTKYLVGIIDHSGNKDKGHYRYFCLSGDDWVCFNDAKINLLCEQSIHKLIKENETSYVLLYSNIKNEI